MTTESEKHKHCDGEHKKIVEPIHGWIRSLQFWFVLFGTFITGSGIGMGAVGGVMLSWVKTDVVQVGHDVDALQDMVAKIGTDRAVAAQELLDYRTRQEAISRNLTDVTARQGSVLQTLAGNAEALKAIKQQLDDIKEQLRGKTLSMGPRGPVQP
jgi:NADP-dependent 3-hydroxy acid dehydrogenase YdfG